MINSKSPAIPTSSGVWLKFDNFLQKIGPWEEPTEEKLNGICEEMGILHNGWTVTSAYYDDFAHVDELAVVISVR